MSIRRMMLFTLGAKIKNLIQAFKERVLATQGEFEAEACLDVQLTELNNDNLLDSASFIVTPNGYRETLLYAVEPNEVGTNLLQQSENFTVLPWIFLASPNVTRTANAGTSPIGTNNATLLTSNSNTQDIGIRQNVPIILNTQYVFSLWARSDNGAQIRLDIGDVNITTFTLTNTWQRIQVIATPTVNAWVDIQFAANQLGKTCLIWGAQLVQGSTITNYISTTDRAIINGTIGDMSVTRATTGTRVNADGFIEQVPYNLFQRSEEFENTIWFRQNILSISTNVANSPIGTLTADKIIPDTTLNQHRIFQQFNFLGPGVLSVYAKADGYNFLSLARDGGVAGGAIIFNLSNGTISGTFGTFVPSIENVGDGWYRCSIFRSDLGAGINLSYWIIVRNDNTTNNYVGNGTSGILVWGAQLVQGTQAKDYFPTTNRFNVPRIDYSNGSCPSILVEPQRTNLVIQSEQINLWTGGLNTTVTPNVSIAPNGIQNANNINITNINGYWRRLGLNLANSTTYAASVFVKKSATTSNKNFSFYYNNNVSSPNNGEYRAVVNLTNLTITTTPIGTITTGRPTIISSSLIDYGNGWYRAIVVFTTGSSAGSSNSEIGFLANGEVVDFDAWGAQLEAGTNATSYIPTTTATVTRNADVITNTNASTLIGQTEGTIFCEFYNPSILEGIKSLFQLSETSNAATNALSFQTSNNSTTNIGFTIFQPTAGTISSGVRTIINGLNKICIVYSTSGTKLFINGVLTDTLNNTQLPVLNQIMLGHRNILRQWGYIDNFVLYKTQITDAQAIELTTL